MQQLALRCCLAANTVQPVRRHSRAGLQNQSPAVGLPQLFATSSSSTRKRGHLVVTAAVKVSKGKQVLCNKTLRCKEGQADAVLAMAQGVAEWSQEVARDKSKGIHAFDVMQDAYEPSLIHMYELYDHASHLSAHNTNERFTSFMEQVQDLLEEPIGMIMYEYRDGKIGAPCLEGGPKGEGGLDDATGASKMGGGAGLRQTSAVVDLTKVVEEADERKGLWGIELPWLKKK